MWIAILLAIVALVALIMWLGARSLRSSIEDGRRLVSRVQVGDIPAHFKECVETFRSKFGVELDVTSVNNAARQFDQLLFQKKNEVKFSFVRPGEYGRFSLPLGAAFGEIIRAHTPAEWLLDGEKGIALRVRVADQFLILRPFDDILNYFSKSHPFGALESKVQAAVRMADIVGGGADASDLSNREDR